jgi:FkbM family methyltransferase
MMIKKSANTVKTLFTRLSELQHLRLIRTSSLFDKDWYLGHNPDVVQANLDPAIHYLRFGGFEGRDPGPDFNSDHYLSNYSDVKQAGMNPLIHFIKYGRKEGRQSWRASLPQLDNGRAKALQSSFLASYISEIGMNIYNSYDDNYDHNRFGEKPEEPLSSTPAASHDATVLSGTLVDSIKLVEPFLSRFERIFENLADEESKRTLIELLAYRALGNKKVRLSLNTPAYWEGIKEIENLSDFSKVVRAQDLQWKLPLIDLSRKGIPVTLYGVPFGIYTQFILEHYKCTGMQTEVEVEDGDVVIDAGACWGDTALYFANMAGPNGRIISFEFVPTNLEIFSRNLELNPHLKDRINIVKNAVWENSNIKVPFLDTGPSTRVNIDDGITGEVETLSIDDLVAQKNLGRVDFIKMDIEGSELAALRGAIKTIKAHRPKLAISIYHKFVDYLEIPEFLLSLDLGYSLYIRHFTIHAEETVLFARVLDRRLRHEPD